MSKKSLKALIKNPKFIAAVALTAVTLTVIVMQKKAQPGFEASVKS